jgi:hypothetical protein
MDVGDVVAGSVARNALCVLRLTLNSRTQVRVGRQENTARNSPNTKVACHNVEHAFAEHLFGAVSIFKSLDFTIKKRDIKAERFDLTPLHRLKIFSSFS